MFRRLGRLTRIATVGEWAFCGPSGVVAGRLEMTSSHSQSEGHNTNAWQSIDKRIEAETPFLISKAKRLSSTWAETSSAGIGLQFGVPVADDVAER